MTTQLQRSGAGFSWEAAEDEGALLVTFHGELDLAVVNECAAGLEEPLAAPGNVVEVSLGDLAFADSTGVRLLVDMKLNTEAHGKRFLLRDISAPILRLLEVTGLTTWFEYAEGHAPEMTTCPLCDGPVSTTARRCRRCGGAI